MLQKKDHRLLEKDRCVSGKDRGVFLKTSQGMKQLST